MSMARFDEVLELVRAGYSKEEITALRSEAVNIPAEQPDMTAAPDPEPVQEPEPVETVQTKTDTLPSDAQYNRLLEAIEKLSNTMISRNINTSDIDVQPARTTDDMIASVLGLKTEPGGKRK